eukprot:4798761-Amphidinium_carterae.1
MVGSLHKVSGKPLENHTLMLTMRQQMDALEERLMLQIHRVQQENGRQPLLTSGMRHTSLTREAKSGTGTED